MRLAVLHSIIQQYWWVYKGESVREVSLTMAIQETRDIADVNDIVNMLTQVTISTCSPR